MPHRNNWIQPAESGIQGDRDFLASLIDRAPDAIFLVSADQRIAYGNLAAGALVDIADQTRLLASHILEEDRSRFALGFAQVRLFAANTQSLEARVIGRNGQPVWMAIQMSPAELDQSMSFGRIIVQMTDIDGRKRMDAAMKDTEERWNSALVNSMMGVWDHNIKTGNFYYSDTWKTLRGIPHGEDIPPDVEPWLENVHADDRDRVRNIIECQNAGTLNYCQFEYRERHRDGHWVWIECRGACIEWDAEGRATRVVGTDTDISQRKVTEESLRSLSQRLELALDVSHIGVFEADMETNTITWDERMLSIFGMEGENHVQHGDLWKEFVHPDDLEMALGRVDLGVEAGTEISNQYRIILRDGRIRHIRARVAPIYEKGRVVRFIGANWDVTADIEIREQLESARKLAEERNRELETAKARIEHDALHDFLTGLPNRRYLDEALSNWNKSGEMASNGLAVMHIDLDRFKEINDTLGHEAGDAVLMHAAQILRQETGPDDFVARIGGDEFVILTSFDGTGERLTAVAASIIKRFGEPFRFKGHMCRTGASIGIAFEETSADGAKQLLLNADIALYRAKGRGRNRHEMFSAEIHNRMVQARQVSDGILDALERKEFIPHYQLQFDAKTLDVAGAETLARWRRPSKGVLSPRSFLSVAEDIDAINEIDALLLEQALVDFSAWRKKGINVPRVSVNISARRLEEPGFAALVSALEFEPGTLAFELLETIFLDESDGQLLTNLDAIRAAGIGIELDDFGTGHASLVSLLTVRPDTMKIARELVMPVAQSREQRNLVGSIIEIGKSRNIRVIAEGVETMDQAKVLADLGCDVLQGYALSSPMPFEAIAGFIATNRWR